MQRGYRYVLVAPVGRNFDPDFRPDLTPPETEALREVLFALRERNLPRVATIWRDALNEVKTKTDALRQISDHLEHAVK